MIEERQVTLDKIELIWPRETKDVMSGLVNDLFAWKSIADVFPIYDLGHYGRYEGFPEIISLTGLEKTIIKEDKAEPWKSTVSSSISAPNLLTQLNDLIKEYITKHREVTRSYRLNFEAFKRAINATDGVMVDLQLDAFTDPLSTGQIERGPFTLIDYKISY